MKSGFFEKLLSRLDKVEPGEIQQIVARLIAEKGFFEKVFEALQEGIILVDATGHIGFLNRAACGFFGIDPEKAIGAPIGAQIRGLDWETLGKPGQTASRDLEVFYPENRFLNFYVAPVDGGDHALGHVLLIRDVTSTRAETAATIESERLNALTLLAAGVAHEIGNPLNSLDIHLQLLGRKFRKLPPGDRKPLEEHLATARQEIQRLDGILKQFLHAVRPTIPRREPCDFHSLLRDTLRLLQPELSARHISVDLNLAKNLPEIPVDPDQFQQVFYNLVRNASQALPGDGGKIRITSRAGDYESTFTIEDNGTGISPEHMGSLFEPYHTTKSAGSGLGLLIVRRIIREHGGDISIESRQGEGTRVVIHLPHITRPIRMLPAPEKVIEVEP